MVTMQDVADRAGVSLTTVSFVVNDTKPVAPTTRAKVEAAMVELGYRRNVLARALASRRTRIIALAFPALEHRLGSSALAIVTSAAMAANDRDFHVVLWPVSDEAHLEDYIADQLVDAVLLMEVTTNDPRVGLLQRLGTPFALIGRTQDPSGLAYVDMDIESAVTEGLEHVLGLGHERVALFVGEAHSEWLAGYGPIERTEAAFRAAMEARGLEPVVVRSAQNPRAGHEAAERLVAEQPDITAVLALNENALYGFVNGLRDAGRRIPADMSVLGLATSTDVITTADPPVSSLVAPAQDLGVRSVEAMVDRLDDPTTAPVHELVRCALQLAGSTGPAPR